MRARAHVCKNSDRASVRACLHMIVRALVSADVWMLECMHGKQDIARFCSCLRIFLCARACSRMHTCVCTCVQMPGHVHSEQVTTSQFFFSRVTLPCKTVEINLRTIGETRAKITVRSEQCILYSFKPTFFLIFIFGLLLKSRISVIWRSGRWNQIQSWPYLLTREWSQDKTFRDGNRYRCNATSVYLRTAGF